MILSPRGWGKRSLVLEAVYRITQKDNSFICIYVDMKHLSNEQELADEIQSRLYQIPSIAHVAGQILFSNSDYMITLPEVVAIKCRINLIICILHYEQILKFRNNQTLQKRLISHWESHTHCAYVLIVSFPPTPPVVLREKYFPFHPEIKMYQLKRPGFDALEHLIRHHFELTGIGISRETSGEIVKKAERIPLYCQLIASQCWLNSTSKCTVDQVDDANRQLITQFSLGFEIGTDGLTEMQVKYLQAIAAEDFQPYAAENIYKFGLKSTAHVARIYKSLISKEILVVDSGETTFLNPIYKAWLKITNQ